MLYKTKLTKRQLEIVCCLANGFTAQETANKLFLSLSTVKATLTVARRKVDARTTPHLVSIIIAQGDLVWTDDDERSLVDPPLELIVPAKMGNGGAGS